MSMSGMSRRDRTVLAVVGGVVLYGLAALAFFMGRQAAWEKSRKAYEREAKALARENRLIAERGDWKAREDEVSVKMPMVEEGVASQTRWQRALEKIATASGVHIPRESPRPEEEHGGVWEMPIDLKFETSLERLVRFLHGLNTAEEGLFDVRDLNIPKCNNGLLSVSMTVTCAYMKGPSK